MKKEELIKTVIELHHAICGNGTKGLSERIDDLEKEVKKIRLETTKYIGFAVGAGIVLGFVLKIVFKL